MSQSWERTPIAASPVSVVVPNSRQAGEALQRHVQALLQAGKSLAGMEIILPLAPPIPEELQKLAQQDPAVVKLVESPAVANGFGAAVRQGIQAAQHPLVLVLPVGYSPEILPQFLKEIDLVDIVCGARTCRAPGWRLRQFFSRAYQLFGLWLQDPECPVRLYRRDLFQHLPLQSQGSFANIEILAKANFQSKLLTEVAIEGPAEPLEEVRGDFWQVLRDPDFGPPVAPVKAEEHKPILTTQAPEATPPERT